MGSRTSALLQQVLALPEDELNELVVALRARLPEPHPAPETDSSEWLAEIEQRAVRVRAGDSAADDWDVAQRRVTERLSDG